MPSVIRVIRVIRGWNLVNHVVGHPSATQRPDPDVGRRRRRHSHQRPLAVRQSEDTFGVVDRGGVTRSTSITGIATATENAFPVSIANPGVEDRPSI